MDEFLTIDEAAEALRLHPRTLRRAIAARRLRAYKRRAPGPFKYAIDPVDLDKYRRYRATLEPTK